MRLAGETLKHFENNFIPKSSAFLGVFELSGRRLGNRKVTKTKTQ